MSDVTSASVWIAAIGLLITFSTFLATVIFRSGEFTARLEELEKWRANLRDDMHEISDQLSEMNNKLVSLFTLVEERTERRTGADHLPPDERRRS